MPIYENWDNLSSLEQHLSSAHYRSYVATVADLVADKVVHKMTEISYPSP